MGNTTQTQNISIVNITKDNVNEIDKYGYPTNETKMSLTQVPFHDEELSDALKNIVKIDDYEINIQHRDNMIIDPITIKDKNNLYELYYLNHDFYHVPEADRNCKYKFTVNGNQTYKFSHISNVQLYFENVHRKYGARL